MDGIYDLDILHLLQYLLTYVRTQSLDGHDVQFLTFEEAFEHIAHGHEILEGLLFGLEINQYIDVAAGLVFATHRRAEQSQFRHTELQQRRFQFSMAFTPVGVRISYSWLQIYLVWRI